MHFEEREPIISEAQLYEDFSVALVHFREILRFFLTTANPKTQTEDIISPSNPQTPSSSFYPLISKYTQNLIINHQLDIIMQRFLARVKEILRHFVSSAPRYRTATTLLLKNLEVSTAKAIQNSQFRLGVLTVLEFIDSFTSKVTQQLSTSHPRIIREDFHSSLQRRKTPEGTVHKQYLEFKVTKKQTEAQEFVKNARKYECMGLDVEYLRGKYFNMKKNEKQQIRDSLNRNQYIRVLMSAFEKSYDSNRSKLVPSRAVNRSRQGKGNGDKLGSAPQLGEGEYKNEQNVLRPMKEDSFLTISNQSVSCLEDKRFRTLDSGGKGKSSSFRNVYEQKFKECRNVRMKNVVICEQDTPVSIHGFNSKKAEFFKKSKEQTKFRYKYYTYIRKEGSNSNHALKARNINPELMLTTLTYK